jgi:DNA primase
MRGQGEGRIYSEEALNEIRARTDIVEVVSGYVLLKQSGNTYKGLCPFHAEKTPSFTVSAEKQLFYCFGCGAGGDVFSFVMKIENMNFGDAAKMLADKAGVALFQDESPEARAAREKRRRLYDCMEAACVHYQAVFANSQEAREARDYVKRRGLSEDTAGCFRLGYAPRAWDSVLKTLTGNGFSREELVLAGLIIPSRSGTGHYDRFRGRLMFPITDISGRVIGFGGRVLDDSEPKYLNSPETELFRKGRTVYGLAVAKNSIRRESRAVIVEGYTDAIMCHQFGFTSVVATLGTALTKEQAETVSRYAPQVIIAYDADAAGGAATLRGMEILQGVGAGVKVAVLPAGEDPDSMLRKYGKEALARVLEDAKPLTAYKLYLIASQTDTSRLDQRVRAAKEAARVLANIESDVERVEYAEKAAKMLDVSCEAMLGDVNRLVKVPASRRVKSRRREGQDRFEVSRYTSFKDDIARSGEVAQVIKAERLLLRLMAENKAVLEMAAERLNWAELSDERHRALAKAIQASQDTHPECAERGSSPSRRAIELIEDGEILEYAAGILVGEDEKLPDDLKKAAEDCINVILEYKLVDRIREIEKELMSLSCTGEMQKSRELLAELGCLKKRISEELQPFRGTS